MLAVFVTCAVIGGALIVISAFAGGVHDHAGGAGHDVDHSFDHGMDHAGDHVGNTEGGPLSEVWLPFLSLRFWTYFMAAFGLIGAVSLFTRSASGPAAFVWGILGGLVAGLSVSLLMRFARGSEVTSSLSAGRLIGMEAKMIVATRPNQPGKARIEFGGEMIDLVAIGSADSEIEIGATVHVIDIDGNIATVARLEDVLR